MRHLFKLTQTTFLTLLSFALIGFSIGGCTSNGTKDKPQEAQSSNSPSGFIPAPKAQEKISQDKAIILDVRELEEIEESAIAKPAKWFPYSKVDSDSAEWKAFAQNLPKDKEIIVYCRSGGRASRVIEELQKMGYQTHNMGGFDSWQEAGLPTRKSVQ